MKLQEIAINQAVGTILVHNVIGAEGRKALSKGRVIRAEDIATLRALGKTTVYAAMLDPTDVREDDAATRLAASVAGEALEASKPSGGRVNLYAAKNGFLRLNVETLKRLNELDGVTLATIQNYSAVQPKKMIATLKTIGLALPEDVLREAEKIGAALSIAAVKNKNVALVLTGSENGRAKTQKTFSPPIRARVEELGARIISESYVTENESEIARAIESAIRAGAQLIVIAGETSIMDTGDITPRGIVQAGGVIELYGAPVEPGNLMLLAYKPREGFDQQTVGAETDEPSRGSSEIPIIGAPGCVKSRERNVVDLILPRLLIGERVTRADVNELAEGGLLIG